MKELKTPSQADWNWDEKAPEIKTKSGVKLYCKESYAKDLYDLYNNTQLDSDTLFEGKILSQQGRDVLVDTFGKYTLSVRLDGKESDFFKDKKIGDNLSIAVLNTPAGIQASAYQYNQIKYSGFLKNCIKTSEPISVLVQSISPRGYLVDYNGVKMILPHLISDVNKPANPEALLGNYYNVFVESYSEQFNQFYVNRKRYMESLQAERLDSLIRGNIYTGIVTGSTSYGVFVQFEEVLTGMIHKDSIAEEWRSRLHEIVPGTEIEFYFRESLPNGKIIITQYWKESLWDKVEIGQILEGKVEIEKPYTWRIRLDWDTCGHITKAELEKLGRTLKLDERVKIQVVEVQPARRKIRLQLV
jgi:ribosomal protein S1